MKTELISESNTFLSLILILMIFYYAIIIQ